MKIYVVQKETKSAFECDSVGLKLTSIFVGDGILGRNARLQLLDLLLQPDAGSRRDK